MPFGFDGQRCTYCCPDKSAAVSWSGAFVVKGKLKLSVALNKVPVIIFGIPVTFELFGNGERGGNERLQSDSCANETSRSGCRRPRAAGGLEGCGGTTNNFAKVCLKWEFFYRRQTCKDTEDRKSETVCTGWRVSAETCFARKCVEIILYQKSDCDDVGG